LIGFLSGFQGCEIRSRVREQIQTTGLSVEKPNLRRFLICGIIPHPASAAVHVGTATQRRAVAQLGLKPLGTDRVNSLNRVAVRSSETNRFAARRIEML
jgi:hypothetical protein